MMNAYQRPLFRQAGGPAGIEALPPPPPAGVAAIPQQDPRAMVEAAEQGASSEMESVGQNYVMEMMSSLDNADSFKTVIDSLRGNEMSLDQRVAELAGYVGEKDAGQTPESVLAMVQPVIMLTEEGNVDSGIGQLMQSLTGEVDMMTEEGDLTDMGQGVGSLMVANQPQQFANGGAVQHFANGSGVSSDLERLIAAYEDFPSRAGGSYVDSPDLSAFSREGRTAPETNIKTLFPQYQGMFREVLDSEGLRDQARSGIMFDIAQAGLNFAGGIDPRTGESTTGLPIASQAAVAASGLPGSISQRIASAEEASRAGDLAALDASMQQVGAERQLAQQIESREVLAEADLTNRFIIAEAELRARDQIAAADRLSDQIIARLQMQYQEYKDSGTLNNLRSMLGREDLLQRYAAGEEMVEYENAIAIVFGRPVRNAAGNWIQPAIPQEIMAASLKRSQVSTGEVDSDGNPITRTVPGYLLGQAQDLADGGAVQHFQQGAGVHALPPELTDPDTERAIPGVQYSPTFGYYQGPVPASEQEPLTSITRGTPEDPVTSDVRKAFGPRAFIFRAGNTIFEAFTGGLFGPDGIITLAPETKEAVSVVNTLADNAQLTMLDTVTVRNNIPLQELIKGLTTPGGEFFTSLADARLQSRDTLRLLQRTFESENNLLQTNEGPLQQQLTGPARSAMVQRVNRIGGLIEDYKLLVQSLDRDTRSPQFRDPMNEILGISE
jgi:hypothetical protein